MKQSSEWHILYTRNVQQNSVYVHTNNIVSYFILLYVTLCCVIDLKFHGTEVTVSIPRLALHAL